ncbi:MAG: class I SAM-dependent methyltransferase [Anaerolineales bacterium]
MLPANDHFIRVYKSRAAAYHALIAAEDADGHLLPALRAITPLAGKRILDLGSGSGRIPLLLNGLDCEIVALDLHHAMLVEQTKQLSSLRGAELPKATQRRDNLPAGTPEPAHRLIQADLRALPLKPGWADVAVAGWAIGHFTGWYSDWKAEAQRALDEMRRATKPGGALIILETLGTGVLEPGPPNAALADYYAWLENELGFRRQVIATDYEFGSVERAAELCGFFFGEQMAANVRANGWSRVPEFTGIWSQLN